MPISFTRPVALIALAIVSLGIARAAVPYTQATVTRTQNEVKYGTVQGDRSTLRPAATNDVVRANGFIQTETDSRAELKYEDQSLVRIGQNTIFSFEAITRTLALGKGSMIFYVPKGSGGANIKTPSLTAAITGTVGKVSANYIAIIEGSITLKPSGRVVGAGQFVRYNPADKSITIDFFNPATEQDGRLVNFNGPMPVLAEKMFAGSSAPFWKPEISTFDTLDRAGNHPGAKKVLDPKVAGPTEPKQPKPPVVVPPPMPTPSTEEPTPPIRF